MNNLFERISNNLLFLIIFFILGLKIIIYIFTFVGLFELKLGAGSDANYYHQYAIGDITVSSSIWPEILAYLNGINLYSREYISSLLLLLNIIFIPILLNSVSNLNFFKDQKNYLYSILIASIYPTLYFYSLDIYRDTFMVFMFLISCGIVKKYIKNTNNIKKLFYFVLALLLGFFLYKIRPYLGYAFLSSLFLWKIKFTKKRILILIFIYFVILFFINLFGMLDSLTEYRSGFEEGSGGSTLGLNFSNPAMFIPNFILSMLGQLFGLYITNPIAVFLFILETIPFIYMLIYIIKNINYADSFIRFLIIFFVLYGSVWLIGNDNLGTAVRLRIFNYFAVYICFFYILGLKNKLYKSRF